ncbi:MAG: hypothetical protein F6K00_07320 [Leptolyngbya sp. SIOISBB]|nr:hypothetical protein [Leptolyngbya sp. SIOISBB]
MLKQKVVLLDGRLEGDESLSPILDLLINELHDSNATVKIFSLRDIKMGSCVGCFGCWIQTPGLCLERDAGRDIVQAVIQSDMTILFTPVTFGGYSSEIKKSLDRWIPLDLPDFYIDHGEVHHQPRYAQYPRLVGIGVQHQINVKEAELFKVLVGRNALNQHSPNYAAEVVLNTEKPNTIRQQLQKALVRHDVLPLAKVVQSLMSTLEVGSKAAPTMKTPGRALLIVGSPKVKSPSTSSVLGGYVLNQLEQQGWDIEALTLRRKYLGGKSQSEFLLSVDQADLILLAFPLYVDSLPFLMMKALEVMAKHLSTHHQETPKRLCSIVNNGFPEAHHNALALSICQRFAVDSDMIWLGGLAVGAGEALVRGQPLNETQRHGPPVKHVIQALDMTSQALASGQMMPDEAGKLVAKSPIPFVPFSIWRWLFIKAASHYWRQKATANQVDLTTLSAQPYADVESAIGV